MVQIPKSLRRKMFVKAGLDPELVEADDLVQERAHKDAVAVEIAARKPIPR